MHWSNVRNDIRDQVLSEDELRQKLREVEDGALDDETRQAARALLAAVTTGDEKGSIAGLDALDKACKIR